MPAASNAQSQIDLHRALAPRYAYRYGFEFSRLFQDDWHAEMISHAPEGTQRVLDLGCGTGFFLAELDKSFPHATGVDISIDMLRVSERYVPGARVVTGDAEAMPFQRRSFDTVFIKGCLHHTRDHVGFLRNCEEILTEEGMLVMSEPANDNPFIRFARWAMYKVSPHFDNGDKGFTRKELESLCRQAGFNEVKVVRYGVLAYVFGGFPDHLGVLRFIPGNAALIRLFIKIDRLICKIPLLSSLAFQVIAVASPGKAAR